MAYIWKLKYIGPSECSGTLTGDPLTALMCSRENGIFTPAPDQEGAPDGWTIGTLVATTKENGRVLKAKMIARNGGQLQWSGGFDSPGTRHFDFVAWSGAEVEVEADKPASESCFANQLAAHGWVAAE